MISAELNLVDCVLGDYGKWVPMGSSVLSLQGDEPLAAWLKYSFPFPALPWHHLGYGLSNIRDQSFLMGFEEIKDGFWLKQINVLFEGVFSDCSPRRGLSFRKGTLCQGRTVSLVHIVRWSLRL